MSINSNHNFLAFGHEIDNSRDWLQSRIFGVCGYSAKILLDRMVQRLIEIGLAPYAAIVKARCKTTENCFPVPGSWIKCDRASIEIGTGRVTISFLQLFANLCDFFLHWSFCLGAIIFTGKVAGNNQPAVLVFGVGTESLFVDESDERFVTYCRLGPITPLRNGKRFFVQSSPKKGLATHAEFIYCARPLIALLRGTQIGFFGRLGLVANHVLLLLGYVTSTFRLPALSLLGRDFAYSAISFDLDRRGLLAEIVLTSSNHHSQPLWVRGLQHATTHLVWYSQSFKSIIYASDNVESDIPSARWMRVDKHWVWTYALAQYLETLVHNVAIEVVDPIVWQMPEINVAAKNAIEIVIFDNPAFKNEVAIAYGEITNYYHPDNLFPFIRDVISLKAEIEKTFRLPVSFKLKTKRAYHADYDRAYFDYLEKLDSSGIISLEHHSTNIYSLISGSHLVIVYPFSSPAYIADYLDIPSIYYDPTNSIVEHHFGDMPSLITFSNSPEALRDAAISALSKLFLNETIAH